MLGPWHHRPDQQTFIFASPCWDLGLWPVWLLLTTAVATFQRTNRGQVLVIEPVLQVSRTLLRLGAATATTVRRRIAKHKALLPQRAPIGASVQPGVLQLLQLAQLAEGARRRWVPPKVLKGLRFG